MAKRKPIILLSSKPYIVSFLSDYGFKVTFADKNNTLFARKAIEFIIGETQPIKSLKHLRNEFEGLSAEARSGLYDVLCRDEHKRVFIVEMQVENYDFILERIQFYAFDIFNSLARKGKGGFKDMSPVHCICIIKGAVTESTKYHQIINLKNEDNEIVMDKLVFHLIELGKFPIGKNELSKITTEKEELLYTMKYAHKFDPMKDVLPPFWEKDFYQVPLKRLDTSKMSPLEAAAYENALMRHKVVVDHHEEKLKKAVQEAVQEETEKAKHDKKEAIKRLLLRNKSTLEEIAEDMKVSIDFVKQVQLFLANSDKSEPKKHSKKAKPK
jgi:predicted transposase/invertase (TIGR01784 family)